MNVEKVFKKFSELLGKEFEASSKWLNLCEEAIDEMKIKIKDTSDTKENEDRLNMAAAALAFYKYVLCNYREISNSAIATFSSEDLTEKRIAISAAKTVWTSAKETINELLKDPDFVFRSVN